MDGFSFQTSLENVWKNMTFQLAKLMTEWDEGGLASIRDVTVAHFMPPHVSMLSQTPEKTIPC